MPAPVPTVLEGRYVRLEPLSAEHVDGLLEASTATGADDRFRYLPEEPPTSRQQVADWVARAAASDDPMFAAVVDHVTGHAVGRQALMRIDPANGVIEIGSILWGPGLARTRGATEAFFLFADQIFALGYRRFEWKCNALNAPSRRAAERFGFGFEGVFRQHMVVKGRNRDTAWFAMLDHEWPQLRQHYQAWLEPANFDADGAQRSRLDLR